MTSKRRARCSHAGHWTAGAGLVAAAMIGMGTAHADDTNDALVLIPAENQEYADVANALYLEPNGFHGTATVYLTPDTGNEVQNVEPGVHALEQTIEAEYAAGDLSPADPLYVFGYSAGAVEEGLAEHQLAADGIPTADLNFVMVGDSASAEGGFLNTVISSLPESLQQPTTELFALVGLTPPVLGATTPDNLYPTEVYSLTGDGWPNWDDGANIYGMFTEHLEYLGLTPAEIASATQTTDGMTTYFSIDSAHVNNAAALYNQLLLVLGIAPSNVATEAASSEASAVATPGEVIGHAIADLNQGTAVLDAAPTADLSARQADVLADSANLNTELDSPLAQMATLQDGFTAADQTVLANADEQFVTAAANMLSADQAFVAADQAGDLSGNTFTSADLSLVDGALGLLSAEFNVTGAELSALFTGGLDLSSAADLTSSLGSAAAADPAIFADLLSSIGW
jgi:hypothetical protein